MLYNNDYNESVTPNLGTVVCAIWFLSSAWRCLQFNQRRAAVVSIFSSLDASGRCQLALISHRFAAGSSRRLSRRWIRTPSRQEGWNEGAKNEQRFGGCEGRRPHGSLEGSRADESDNRKRSLEQCFPLWVCGLPKNEWVIIGEEQQEHTNILFRDSQAFKVPDLVDFKNCPNNAQSKQWFASWEPYIYTYYTYIYHITSYGINWHWIGRIVITVDSHTYCIYTFLFHRS